MNLTVEQALEKAIQAQKDGNSQDAEHIYRAILQAQPSHSIANYNLGALCMLAKKPRDAIPFLKSALDNNPKAELFWLTYIEALFSDGQIDNSRSAIRRARSQGMDASKLSALEKKITTFSGHPHRPSSTPPQQAIDSLLNAYQSGNYDIAEELAISKTQRFPQDQLAWKILGAILQQTGRGSESVGALQTAVDLAPNDVESHYNLGVTLQGLGRFEEARASYAKALALKPGFAEAHSGLGNVLQVTKRLEDAEKSYAQAVALKPGLVEAHYNRASTLKELGRLEEAEDSYNQAIGLQPGFAEAHSNLGVVQQELGMLDEAVASFVEATRLQPNYAGAFYNLGITLRKLDRLEEAEHSYKRAIEIRADFPETHNNLGNILYELSRLEEAETSFRQAIELNPAFAEAHNNLGNTLKELGRLEEAATSCAQAISLKSDYAEAHNNLGNTLKELGRLEEAEDSYNQAINLNPVYKEAQLNLAVLLTFKHTKVETGCLPAQVDREIKSMFSGKFDFGKISDSEIVALCNQAINIIDRFDLNLECDNTQIFRRNKVDMNCSRHLQIFNDSNIIPKFCFGCFKVQIEPSTILELIKLVVIFDQLTLDQNNTRKCLVELREQFQGSYKGLVYCDSVEQANQIKKRLEPILYETFGSDINVSIKHGCSEYYASYPEYKTLDQHSGSLMKYNENWEAIEKEFDEKNYRGKARPIPIANLPSVSLHDVLIFRNWIDYAKGIGDRSTEGIKQEAIWSQTILDAAKKRKTRLYGSI